MSEPTNIPKRGPGRPSKKGFSNEIVNLVKEAEQVPVSAFGDLEALVNGIQLAGDGNDPIQESLTTTSDRTVAASALVEEPEEVEKTKPLVKHNYHDLGTDTEVNPHYRNRVGELTASGKSFQEAEKQAEKEGLSPKAATIQPGEAFGPNVQQSPTGNVPPMQTGEVTPATAPKIPLTDDQLETNQISAEELIALYDTLQSGGSMWAYNHFAQPENARIIAEKLQPKVLANSASEKEREMFAQANSRVIDFQKRKEVFAGNAVMSEDSKVRATRILGKIMAARGVNFPPEALLLLLLLTPLIVNGGKIMFERMGYKEGDDMLAQFNQFVDKKSIEFDKSN